MWDIDRGGEQGPDSAGGAAGSFVEPVTHLLEGEPVEKHQDARLLSSASEARIWKPVVYPRRRVR
jgi:hypothetical protein